MTIPNTAPNNITQAQGKVSGSAKGSAISKGFLQALQNQMVGWLKALEDQQITEREVSNMASASGAYETVPKEEQGEVLYDGSAAYLYATTQINDVSNLMSWIFNFNSIENQLHEKASSMLTA